MFDPYEVRDQILGDAIDRIGKGEEDAGLGPLVGGAIGDIETETRERAKKAAAHPGREATERAKAVGDMERIKKDHKNHKVTPEDLQRARDINGSNRAERDREELNKAIPQATRPTKGPVKPRL